MKEYPQTLAAVEASEFSKWPIVDALLSEVTLTSGGERVKDGEYERIAQYLATNGYATYTARRIKDFYAVGAWLGDSQAVFQKYPFEWVIEAKQAAKSDHAAALTILARATRKRDIRPDKATAELARTVLTKLPPKARVSVAAEVLDSKDAAEALSTDEEAQDHIYSATVAASGFGKGKKVEAPPKHRGMREMTVVMALIGVLGEIRELAEENPDSPLLIECKNLMRETLSILEGIEEVEDPGAVQKMLDDFGDYLTAQQ